MALPKLNDTPKYSLTIPSSGKKVNYRPYLVKEEKILMMASETGTQSSTVQAIVDTILACVDAEIDKNDLTSFDVEYMFLNLRSKSVGEKANVTIECIECMEHNDLEIDLSTIEVSKPALSNQIEITDNITLHMSYPNFKAIMDADDAGDEDADADDADADGLKVWICVRVGGRGWAWVGGLVLIVRSRKY